MQHARKLQGDFGSPELHKLLVQNGTSSPIEPGTLVRVSGAAAVADDAQLTVIPAQPASDDGVAERGLVLVAMTYARPNGEFLASLYRVITADTGASVAGTPLYLDADGGWKATFTAGDRLVGYVLGAGLIYLAPALLSGGR